MNKRHYEHTLPNIRGSLSNTYIEPQHDNSKGSVNEWKDVRYLCESGQANPHYCRGIMRIDNKLFNTDFIEIFDK